MARSEVNGKRDQKRELPVSAALLTRVVVLMTAATLLVWLVVWLRMPTTLPVRSVHFEGAFKHIRTENLKAAVSGDVVGGFFSLDIEVIRSRLLDMPWVDKVSVRRVWPDVLKIRVVEQVPVARWGKDALLNSRGEVFEGKSSRVPVSLPRFTAPDGLQARVLKQYREANRLMAATGLKVIAVSVNQRRAWKMMFSNNIEVRLGRRDVTKRLLRFVSVYPGVLAARSKKIEVVDMRYTNGLAVRWKKQEQGKGAGNKGENNKHRAAGGAV